MGRWKDRLEVVNIDSIGLGWGFALHIQDHGYPVGFVNVAKRARNKLKYKIRKDEYFWALRVRIEAGLLAGLRDNLLFQQLAAIKYEEDAGRTVIESKDEMKKRGLSSPDRADALMLAFAQASQSRTTGIPVGSGTSDPDDQERKQAPYESQFESSPIGSRFRAAKEREQADRTCGGCAHFKVSVLNAEVGRCEARMVNTKKAAVECEIFEEKG